MKEEFKTALAQGTKVVLDSLHEEKKEIEKKIYLMTVLSVVNSLKKLFALNIESDGIQEFAIKHGYDHDYGNEIEIMLIEHDEEEKVIHGKYDFHVRKYGFIFDDFQEFNGFKKDWINAAFRKGENFFFPCNDEGISQFITMVLSPPLHAVFLHALLDNKITNTSASSRSKPKV